MQINVNKNQVYTERLIQQLLQIVQPQEQTRAHVRMLARADEATTSAAAETRRGQLEPERSSSSGRRDGHRLAVALAQLETQQRCGSATVVHSERCQICNEQQQRV